MSLILIAAVSENRIIGRNGGMPWNLKSDLKFFKKVTTGSPVIMGRKTYQSLGKALPNRGNIVITRDINFQPPDAVVTPNLRYAIELASDLSSDLEKEENHVFIIGGGEIFKQAMPFATHMYLSHIKATIDGDTYFPEFDEREWRKLKKTSIKASDLDDYDFDIIAYARTL